MALEFLGAAGNLIGSVGGALVQNALGRANEKRQWDEYYSPQAQVRNLAAAGINPAVAMGNQSPVLTSGGQMQMPDVPNLGLGTTALSEIGNYLNAVANAKKAGADTRSSEEDVKLKQIEQSRNQFELQLRQKYGLKQAAQNLSLAEANVRLAQLSGDNAEIDKAIKEYTKAKEKALSECQEKQRDILQKELDNKDTELKLSNRVLKTQGDSNIASANASNAAAKASLSQADVNRETRRLQSALADVEEAGKLDKINSLIAEYKKNGSISDADAKEADIKLSRLNDIQDKRSSYFFKEVDGLTEWLKSKISIFK